MNFRIGFVLTGLALQIVSACGKSAATGSSASVMVVNAVPTSNNLIVLFSNDVPKYFSSALSIGYGGAALYSPPSGNRSVSVIQSTDTAKSIFASSLQFAAGGIYSLFLAGDTTRPDTLLIKDKIINYSSDSAGVRFVNLSVGGKSLSVNLEGGSPGDFATLAYKGVSDFKSFNADVNGPGGYNFEIHDPVTGDLLTTFTWYYTDHKNNTVVIAGSPDPDSPTPLNVFQVNHF
jgi:hypothetical protein